MEGEISECDVGDETQASTAPIRWVASGYTGPGFDVGTEGHVGDGNVAGGYILDCLKGSV